MGLFGIISTIIVYGLSLKLKQMRFFSKIPPILFTGVLIILVINILNISYSDYNSSASILTFLLGPATIALAFPLVKNIDILSKNKRAIWFGLVFAALTAIFSTYAIGKLLGTDLKVIMSMVPKSVTTPIAVEISKVIGGIPELTACVVILTGIVGGLSGHRFLKFFGIKNNLSIGLSIGATSHVLGTARCLEKKQEKQAAMSTLALIIVGILTSIIAPLLLHLHFKV